jgi:hypothetical protein
MFAFEIVESRSICYVLSLPFVGTAYVTLKDSVFQASSPLRHMVELLPLLKTEDRQTVALLMFTNGGPDHNCKHLSVYTALLALFLMGGMDTMVVLRTDPQQSWTNPAERVMSNLNLGLQGCSLARTLNDENFEATMRKCNKMTAIRRAATSSCNAVESAQRQQLPSPNQEEVIAVGDASRDNSQSSDTSDTDEDDSDLEDVPLKDLHNLLVSSSAIATTATPSSPLPNQASIGLDVVTSALENDRSRFPDSNEESPSGVQVEADGDVEVGVVAPSVVPDDVTPYGILHNVCLANIPVYDNENFEEVYASSIARPLQMVEDQFRQLIWNDNSVKVQQPATIKEVR